MEILLTSIMSAWMIDQSRDGGAYVPISPGCVIQPCSRNLLLCNSYCHLAVPFCSHCGSTSQRKCEHRLNYNGRTHSEDPSVPGFHQVDVVLYVILQIIRGDLTANT
jgi:hypothetical protein